MKNIIFAFFLAFSALAHAYDDEIDIAFNNLTSGNYDVAFNILKPKAEAGDSVAQVTLGKMYHLGSGVPVDKVEAFKWYQLSSNQGDPIGDYNLALMYMNGDGVNKNVQKAFELFKKSAAQNFSESQYELGQLYQDGYYSSAFIIKQDNVKAADSYKMAVENNNTKAMYKLSMLHFFGKGVPQDYNEAIRLAKIASDSGDNAGRVLLATYYNDGIATPKNTNEALRLYLLAAEAGNKIVFGFIANIYSDQSFKGNDQVLAYAFLNLAAVNDSKAATARDKIAIRLNLNQIKAAQMVSLNIQKNGVKMAINDYYKKGVKL